MRNILEKARKRDYDEVKAEAQAIYLAESRAQAIAAFRVFRSRWCRAYPAMVRRLQQDLPELLSQIQGSTEIDGDAFWALVAPLHDTDQYSLKWPGTTADMRTRANMMADHSEDMTSPGWPQQEGLCNGCASVNPIYAYPHGAGAAITSVLVYTGSEFGPSYTQAVCLEGSAGFIDNDHDSTRIAEFPSKSARREIRCYPRK